VTIGANGTVRVWVVETAQLVAGQPISPWIYHSGVVQRAAFILNGRSILTSAVGRPGTAETYQVQVWDAATGQPLAPPSDSVPTLRREWISAWT
jgi:hypothetical protein